MKENFAHVTQYGGKECFIVHCYADSYSQCAYGELDPQKKMRCKFAKYGGDMGEARCTQQGAREEVLREREIARRLEYL